MIKIGYRTIKTAIGAPISIFLAQLFGLDFAVSAGILTILCIQPTKKTSISSSLKRITACFIGIILCFLLFEGIGYTPISIGLLIILFLPILIYFKLQTGFITGMVVIFHFFNAGVFSIDLMINEVMIMLIGIGVGLLLNLYMPNMEKNLREYQQNIEDCFRTIFEEFGHYLQTGKSEWHGQELLEAESYIEKAKELALKDIENQLIKPKSSFFYYFSMRERQLEILERMLPIISSFDLQVPQREAIVNYLYFLSEKINPSEDTISASMTRLHEMREDFKKNELPQTRHEFETRAALYQLIREIDEYLTIKKESFFSND